MPDYLQITKWGMRLGTLLREHRISPRKLNAMTGNRQYMSITSLWRLTTGTLPDSLSGIYISRFSEIQETIIGSLKVYFSQQKFDANKISTLLDPLINLELPNESLIRRTKPAVPKRQKLTISTFADITALNQEDTDILEVQEELMIPARCELPAEIANHFGLEFDPFAVEKVLSLDQQFRNPELDELTARLVSAATNQKFVAVVGSVGSGKTTVKNRLIAEIQDQDIAVTMITPEFFNMGQISVDGVAKAILSEFEVPAPGDKYQRVKRIRELLSNLQQDGEKVCLIFDEAHQLNPKLLTALKNFWEMVSGENRLLGIILFGQPQFVSNILSNVRFSEIAQRVQVYKMPRLAETARQYLTHRFSIAGANIDNIFDDKVTRSICLWGKTPLQLGNIANEILCECFILGEKKVELAMLNEYKRKMTSLRDGGRQWE